MSAFLAATFTTLAISAWSAHFATDFRTTIVLLVIYAVAYGFQRWLFEEHFVKADATKKSLEETAIFFAGELVEPNAGVSVENQALEKVFHPLKQAGTRIGFIAIIVLVGLARYSLGVELKFADLILIVSAILIVPAISANHFLPPLALSAVAVLLDLNWLAVPYAISFLATLVFYRYLELSEKGVVASQSASRFRVLAQSALVFAAIVGAVNLAVPEHDKQSGQLAKVAEKLNEVQYKASELAARKVTEAASKQPAKRSLQQSLPSRLSKHSTQQGLTSMQQQGSARSAEPSAELNKLAQMPLPQPPNGGKDLEKEENLYGGQSEASLNPENMPGGNSQIHSGEDPLKKAQQLLDAAQKMSAAAGSGQPQLQLQRQEQKSRTAPQSAPGVANEAAPSESSNSGPSSANATTAIAAVSPNLTETGSQQPTESMTEAPAADEPPPPKKELFSEGMLKRLFMGLAVLAAILFLRKLPAKADPKKQKKVRLSRERRRKLSTELEAIESKKLDPREEVIARYHYYLKIMEAVEVPREEYLPPEDYNDRVRKLFPPIEPSTSALTHIFCDTYYGQFEVKPQDLSSCRQSTVVVSRFFSI